MMTMLEVEQLHVFYGKDNKNHVVKGINFNLYSGEILGIIGRSGSGKSTIAWTIMGMIEHMNGEARGKIIFEDRDILNITKSEYEKIRWKEIAIVPQAAMNSFNPVKRIHESIMEVLNFHQNHLSKDEKEKRAVELIEMCHLPRTVLSLYPHQMSGGMKQRAAIALALVCNPQILILDEATTGLDVLTEVEVLKMVSELQQKYKMSIIFISHDMRLVNALCNRSIFIEDGLINYGDASSKKSKENFLQSK